MAQHKFASNVCEKALVTATSELRSALIDEIIVPKREGANVVMTMMRDQYASECSGLTRRIQHFLMGLPTISRLCSSACFVSC